MKQSVAAAAVLLALAAGAGAGAHAAAAPIPVRALSSRPDRISGGDALIEVASPVAGAQTPSVTVASGLTLTLWAQSPLVVDPIAIDMDSFGAMYVSASPRSGQLLDIRQHADWVPGIHTLTSVDDLREFFRRVLAPERSASNTWLPDANRDGVRDWRDLMVAKERIYRLRDTNADGAADTSQVVYEGFNDDVASDIAGGLLLSGSDLYVAAAPDLWKLRDVNGDGVFDTKESISHGYSVHPAVSGHDLSAITQGPDGRIYWKVGDIGFNVVDQSGRRWVYPNQGAILRANPDGSNFEVFAAGLRNTQEIAFDQHGNLLAVDNDADYPGETERVVYITQGSDAGWRSTWQYGKFTDAANNKYNPWIDEGLSRTKFDGQAAYIVPPVAPYHAGPAGFAYNPGTALDARWQGQFFVTSFTGNPSSSRIYAIRLTERGAGIELASDTEILKGICSPGLRIGPDGALYLTDWISGFNAKGSGRVWKLDATSPDLPMRQEVATLLRESFAGRSAATLQTLLAHEDMRVRQKAQFELVRRKDTASLLATARRDAAPLARIHAIWGIGQLARVAPAQALALTALLRDGDGEIRAQTAKMLGDAGAKAAAASIVPLLADPAPRARFYAAEALGRLRVSGAIQPLVQMLAENGGRDVYLRHAGSYALARIGDVPALIGLSQHPARDVRLAAVVALRRLREPGVAVFLADQDDLVVAEAARAINDEGGIPAALPALARLLTETRSNNEVILRRAISANVRLGTPDAADRVGVFSARAGASQAILTEALAALAVWDAPSPLDRVDGASIASQLPKRDLAPSFSPRRSRSDIDPEPRAAGQARREKR